MATPSRLRRALRSARRSLAALVLAQGMMIGQALGDELAGTAFTTGDWWGAAYGFDEPFSSCIASGLYGTTTLSFELYRDGSLSVYLDDPSWRVTKDSRNPVALRVDQGNRRSLTAVGMERGYYIDFGVDPVFVEALATSRQLVIEAAGSGLPFELQVSGGAGAVRLLEDCLWRHGRITAAGTTTPPTGGAVASPIESGAGKAPLGGAAAGGSNPFADPGSGAVSTAGGAGALDEREERVVREMLIEVGYPYPEFSKLDSGALSWSSLRTGIIGAIGYGLASGTDIQAVQASVNRFAEDCGNRAQLLYDKVGQGSEGKVYSGRVDCLPEDTQIFFVAFESDGSLILIVHIAPVRDAALGQQINNNLRRYLMGSG